jgi:hypothetical protein
MIVEQRVYWSVPVCWRDWFVVISYGRRYIRMFETTKGKVIAAVVLVTSTLTSGVSAFVAMGAAMGTHAAGVAQHVSAYTPQFVTYTVPTGLVPSDVSSDNLVAIFSQFITNGAVLTLVLAGMAVGLFGYIVKAIRKARSA